MEKKKMFLVAAIFFCIGLAASQEVRASEIKMISVDGQQPDVRRVKLGSLFGITYPSDWAVDQCFWFPSAIVPGVDYLDHEIIPPASPGEKGSEILKFKAIQVGMWEMRFERHRLESRCPIKEVRSFTLIVEE